MNLIDKLADSLDKYQNQIAIEESKNSYSYRDLKQQILFFIRVIKQNAI